MEFTIAKSAVTKMARTIKLLVMLSGALLVCNATLASLLWAQSTHKDIVLIPSTLQAKANITQNGVSASYLGAMAVMLINERLNVTPENIKGSNQAFITFVSPEYYTAFKKQLSDDAKTIIAGKIASSFYLMSMKTNVNNLTVTITGNLKRWVGERLIDAEQKQYQLKFLMTGLPLSLTSFVEIKKTKENNL